LCLSDVHTCRLTGFTDHRTIPWAAQDRCINIIGQRTCRGGPHCMEKSATMYHLVQLHFHHDTQVRRLRTGFGLTSKTKRVQHTLKMRKWSMIVLYMSSMIAACSSSSVRLNATIFVKRSSWLHNAYFAIIILTNSS